MRNSVEHLKIDLIERRDILSEVKIITKTSYRGSLSFCRQYYHFQSFLGKTKSVTFHRKRETP